METNFEQVSDMNTAFGNPKGDPANINWPVIRSQCKNIGDEWLELQVALGADPAAIAKIREAMKALHYPNDVNVEQVRDGICDIHVFGYGAHHLMGIDADRDMKSVVDGVMTRFIKDEEDEKKTIAKHAAAGVTDVTVEGEYPTKVLRSNSDQPDAPKGKFLKSASFSEPVFYALPQKTKPTPKP